MVSWSSEARTHKNLHINNYFGTADWSKYDAVYFPFYCLFLIKLFTSSALAKIAGSALILGVLGGLLSPYAHQLVSIGVALSKAKNLNGIRKHLILRISNLFQCDHTISVRVTLLFNMLEIYQCDSKVRIYGNISCLCVMQYVMVSGYETCVDNTLVTCLIHLYVVCLSFNMW